MKKNGILKYQFSGVMRDATSVKKPDKQIVVKPTNNNWQQLVANNQPKQQQRLFELTPEIKKEIEEHTKKGDIQLTNGQWITKDEYNKLKAKKSTGAINPDYSDPLTASIMLAAAPAQGLAKTALPKLTNSKVGKVVAEGIDMLDPTSIGINKSITKDINSGQLNYKLENLKEANNNLTKQYNSSEFVNRAKQMGLDNKTIQQMNYNANSLNNNSGYFDVNSDVYKKNYSENAGGYVEKNIFDRIPIEAKQNPLYKEVLEDIKLNQGKTRINPKLSDNYQKTIQTHEGTHKITDADNLIPENVKKELTSLFKKDDYYSTPTEIHARMNQIRHLIDSKNPYKKLNYEDVFDKNNNLKPEFEQVTGSDKQKFGDLIKDKKRFIDLMNKMYSASGLIGTGLGIKSASNQESKKQGGLFKDGGKMDCGCNIVEDNIDTDVLFDLPQQVFDLLSKSIGLKKGTKYDNKIKDKLKEDAKLNNMNLRDYLMKNPDVSKHITIIEMKRNGGVLKYQKGKKTKEGLQTEHGMIYDVKVDKPVKFNDLAPLHQEIILNKQSVKPKFLENGLIDDEANINSLTEYVFPKNIDDDTKKQLLEEYMQSDEESANRLNYAEFTDRDVNNLKLFVNKRLKLEPDFSAAAFRKYQAGGLAGMGYIMNRGHNMNKLSQMMMVGNLYKPEMQQGGKLDQKAFIQWLAQKLGVKSEQEFKQAVAKLGEEGLAQAQQAFMQEQQGVAKARQGMMFRKGGILKYQQGGFRPFNSKEVKVAKTPEKAYRYTPGTYDVSDNSANTYNNVTSSPQYDAKKANAQSKINYEQGVGQRTQSGLAGNRGKEGVNLTDRLAKERQELQTNWNKLATDKEFQAKRLMKGKDGRMYVVDSTGQYNLGLYEEKTPQLPDPPKTKPRKEYVVLPDKDVNNPYLDIFVNDPNNPKGALTRIPKTISQPDFIRSLETAGINVKRNYDEDKNRPKDYYFKGQKSLGMAGGDTVGIIYKNNKPQLDYTDVRPYKPKS